MVTLIALGYLLIAAAGIAFRLSATYRERHGQDLSTLAGQMAFAIATTICGLLVTGAVLIFRH